MSVSSSSLSVHHGDAFSSFSFVSGLLWDACDNPHPTQLYAWTEDVPLVLAVEEQPRTVFGYVYKGPTKVEAIHNQYTLQGGQYFSVNESLTLSGGRGIAIVCPGYQGLNALGGPVEAWGRLRYIDGCTDTLLLPPVKRGDACLNALFFPPETDQTPHTHPSVRVGMIIRGRGECITADGVISLVPGMIFVIHQEQLHSFRTGDASMTVIAFHPDSDFGPQDEDHPMINRTIIDGKSAAGAGLSK